MNHQQTTQEQPLLNVLEQPTTQQPVPIEVKMGLPTWMLTGFPATSSEPDEDDPIDFL